jgi:hypothetical protein
MISFLVSVKDTAKYLPDLLPSLRACGVPHEIVVRANGRSQWEATEKQLVDYRVQLIKNYEEMSLSDSLNGLVECASREFVMRVDPDDKLSPGVIPFMRDEIAYQDDFAYGDYYRFADGYFRDGMQRIRCKRATAKLLAQTSVGPYNFMADRDFVMAVQWKEVGYEDHNMYIRMMAAGGNPRPMNIITLYNRVRAGGRQDQFAQTHEERMRAMLEDNKEWFSREL